MTRINVQVFAVLKDYFKPTFEINIAQQTIEGLVESLIQLNPSAKHILQSCRFAQNENLVSLEFKLTNHDTIAILPPSSGG